MPWYLHMVLYQYSLNDQCAIESVASVCLCLHQACFWWGIAVCFLF